MVNSDRSFRSVLLQFKELGVTRVLIKELAPNDNSKNQIYVGWGFESLNFIPVRQISPKEPARRNEKRINFKAKLNWLWLSNRGCIVAPRAQLILYPAYPEVRISGFLDDCVTDSVTSAPMSSRLSGRVLFLGIAQRSTVYAYVGNRNSRIVTDWKLRKKQHTDWEFVWRSPDDWSLREIPLKHGRAGFYRLEFANGKLESGSIREILERLQQIHRAGWHDAARLKSSGVVAASRGENSGGNTLECLFGIASNASKEPDYKGWELKNIDALNDRITLVTPEPRGGLYAKKGVVEFVKRFGT